jgi:hypothetical protein
MYVETLPTVISQGDIFTRIALLDSATALTNPRFYDVIVFSHTCEIAKPSNTVVLVCGIRPLREVLDRGQQGHIQRNRVYNSMYLSPVGPLGESFVDFRFVFRVQKALLDEAMRQGLRIASLNEESRLALFTYLYRFLLRKVPG